MRASLGPARAHHVVHDVPGVADQVIAPAIVFEIVVASQAANMHEFAARAKPGRAAHPGQYDLRPILPKKAPHSESRAIVEQASEWQLDRRQTTCPKRRRALGVPADDNALALPRSGQRQREAHEECLGTAVTRTGDCLHEAGHGMSASKRAATSPQESPFWRVIAAWCRSCQSASSLSSAMAAVAKASSSPATAPVTPSSTRSGRDPSRVTTAGIPKACA